MNEEERQVRVDGIQRELERLVQELLNVTDMDAGTNGLLTACVIAFEGTRFDDKGKQAYRTDHICIGATSYSASIGILQEALWHIHHKGFGHCSPGDV